MRYLVFIILFSATMLSAQPPREIIDRYIDTVSNGDIRHWETIKSVYSESEGYYSHDSFEGKVNILRPDKSSFSKSYRVPPFHRKIEHYEDSTFTRRVSEFYFLKKRTIILLGNVPPIIKPARTRDKYASDYLPVRVSKLAEASQSIELLGVKEFPLDGIYCYEIRITTDGRKYLLYINTETFLLEYWNGRADLDASILSKVYDYRKVGDLLIPMSSNLMRNGAIYFSSRTTKYVINAEIDPAIFEYEEKP